MIQIRHFALPTLALVALLAGCNDAQKTTQLELLNQNEELTKQIASSNDKLNAMGEQLARAQQQTTDLQSQLEACNQRASTAGTVKETVTVVDAKDFQGIEGVEATMEGGDIHLTIANSLLFDSGKTALKDTAKKSLDKVSSTIKNKYGTREILVVGYTDSDPIRKASFPSNYHLGFERAYSVRGYLDRKGVVGAHMGLVSFGPDRPEGSKEKSRRVEVIVTAKEANSGDSSTSMKEETPKNAPSAAEKSTVSKASAGRTSSKSAPSTSSSRKTSTPASSSSK